MKSPWNFIIRLNMTKSYSQLIKQIGNLQREADEVRKKEIAGVVSRIKEAIKAYNLTASDLGLAAPRAARGRPAATKGRRPGRKGPAVVKFKDGQGNTWGGRGPRPAWLREALASGKQLSDFAV